MLGQELAWHPERRSYWESQMRQVWRGFAEVPPQQRRLAAGLHWALVPHVLDEPALVSQARAAMDAVGVRTQAEQFAEALLAVVADKKAMAQLLFRRCPELPQQSAALVYLRGEAGPFELGVSDLLQA